MSFFRSAPDHNGLLQLHNECRLFRLRVGPAGADPVFQGDRVIKIGPTTTKATTMVIEECNRGQRATPTVTPPLIIITTSTITTASSSPAASATSSALTPVKQ